MPEQRKSPKIKSKRVARSLREHPEASRPIIPGYELSSKKAGLLPWNWAVGRLKKSRQYWIATARPDGAPHLMIIWGVWVENSFWFSTGPTSRKARNLDANPRCVIATDNAAEAVILEGTAKACDRQHAGFDKFATAYEKKYGWDVRQLAHGVYRFRAQVGFGLCEKKFDQTATRWVFR